MSRMIKWPSIDQYRQVVKNVQHQSAYVGMGADGNPIFDKSRKAPTLKFEGTVKLHGTNGSVILSLDGESWVQSRENIITPEKDNAGFAMFARKNISTFYNIGEMVANTYQSHGMDAIAIFGEWCGGNIQKGVAISQLPKMFVIFGIALVDIQGNKTYLTREQVLEAVKDNIGEESQTYCIYNFQTFEIEIDFENPHLVQNELNKLTEFVGDICPVGYSFGVTEGCTTGEGIVWRCIEDGYQDSGYWFKVKDARHSNSKIKTLATVDVQRIENIKELSLQLANNGRLTQVCQITFNLLNDGEIDIKRTGDFIKAVMVDIYKEDLDIIAASGFNMKEISGTVAKICRDFLMNSLT